MLLVLLGIGVTAGGSSGLPFDRARISRYSVDGLPRSIAIRQGQDVWLGYDLERARVFKVWQVPAGTDGLESAGFTTRSRGTTWYEDGSAEGWRLQTAQGALPLDVRYLGCSQREDCFELRWELRHESHAFTLSERVFLHNPTAGRVVREMKVEGLPADTALLPPPAGLKAWRLSLADGRVATVLTNERRYQCTLP